LPVIQDGVRNIKRFECDQDVWDVVDLCENEAYETNLQGNDFDIVDSIITKMYFFACPNMFLREDHQKDIQRYLYCEEFGISPYPGSYGQQPYKWIQKSFLFKKAFGKQQKKVIDNGRKNTNKV
tara:strand:+ start:857 stop:1228 length:372 start_codon:yes stop_codon:yes gene_type:complete